MKVFYRHHAFEFEPLPDQEFAGRLVLNDRQRELLAQLEADEDENWYLDEDGERLPAEQLFAHSPWSCLGPDGPVKLLCRLIDLRDGTIRFNTLELYPGDLFRWMRTEGGAPDATA